MTHLLFVVFDVNCIAEVWVRGPVTSTQWSLTTVTDPCNQPSHQWQVLLNSSRVGFHTLRSHTRNWPTVWKSLFKSRTNIKFYIWKQYLCHKLYLCICLNVWAYNLLPVKVSWLFKSTNTCNIHFIIPYFEWASSISNAF